MWRIYSNPDPHGEDAMEYNYYVSNIISVSDRDLHTISSNLMHYVHILENYVSSEIHVVMAKC
jgi:hypothetical protein